MKWILAKLKYITDEFLAGGGNGQVYECAYLCYIECREVVAGRDPNIVWDRFTEERQKAVGKGNRPTALSATITDRQELVDALRKFARQFEMPRSRKLATPTKANKPAKKARKKPAASRAMGSSEDLLDFLTGDT